MKIPSIGYSVLVLMACVAWPSMAQPAKQFWFNGAQFQPEVASIHGTAENPQPGDVIWIRGFGLVLGNAHDYRFFTRRDRGQELYLALPDGSEQLVAVELTLRASADAPNSWDVLQGLDDRQIRKLWGVTVRYWDEPTAGLIGRLDPERTLVELHGGAQAGRRLPPLPHNLRYLALDHDSGMVFEDLTDLSRLKLLRFFRFRSTLPYSLDLSLLQACSGLRYLSVAGAVTAPQSLAALRELRTLSLQGIKEISDIEFVSHLPELRHLDISRTRVADLRPLAGHRRLISLNANLSPVTALPRVSIPSLRRMLLISTPLDDASAAAFADANPFCAVVWRYEDAVHKLLREATGLRVRAGGPAGPFTDQDETLFRTDDLVAMRELIHLISIDEQRSQGTCFCGGDPTIEFYCGSQLLGSLTLMHGTALRWPGVWPNDAQLSVQSSESLVRWLASRGVDGPLRQIEGERRAAEAMKEQIQAYARVMPDRLREAFTEAQTNEERLQAIRGYSSGKVEDARLYLRLFGSQFGDFDARDYLSWNLLRTGLPNIDRQSMTQAIRDVIGESAGARGAVRWLLFEQHWKSLQPDDLEQMLPLLMKAALADQSHCNRHECLRTLRRIGTRQAILLLRQVVDNEINLLLPETPADAESPHEAETRRKGDATLAAELLASLGDRQSAPAIRQLAELAQGAERERLRKALEILEENSSGK